MSTTVDAIATLLKNGYLDPVFLPNGHWAACHPFMFTAAVITGSIDEVNFGYSNRWCYETMHEARQSLKSWVANFETQLEPEGWHRHPSTGRRRPEGDAAHEYVNL